MSNKEYLLDVGEGSTVDNDHASSNMDPFDPFTSDQNQSGPTRTIGSLFDEFDPFAFSTATTKDTSDTMETSMQSDVSEQEQQSLAAQFDDLMGGMGSSDSPPHNGHIGLDTEETGHEQYEVKVSSDVLKAEVINGTAEEPDVVYEEEVVAAVSDRIRHTPPRDTQQEEYIQEDYTADNTEDIQHNQYDEYEMYGSGHGELMDVIDEEKSPDVSSEDIDYGNSVSEEVLVPVAKDSAVISYGVLDTSPTEQLNYTAEREYLDSSPEMQHEFDREQYAGSPDVAGHEPFQEVPDDYTEPHTWQQPTRDSPIEEPISPELEEEPPLHQSEIFEDQPTSEGGQDTQVSSNVTDKASEEGMSGSGGSDRDTGSPVKFEDTLSDFQLPKRYTKPDGKAADYSNKAPTVYITGAGGANDCTACGKRVYEMEKMLADKAIYHKTCFKCNHCKRVLSLGNFASLEGKLYCKPHFIELFRTKGNYEEGFGIERHSKQWQADQPGVDSEGAVARYETTDINDQSNTEIVTEYTGEDGGYDEYDSRQTIGSVKSRYQEFEQRSPSPTDEDRSNVKAVRDWDQSASPTQNGMDWTGSEDLVKTTNNKEEIPYTEIKSVRNIFEKSTPSSEARYTPASKKASKWDKPKQAAPVEVVNANREEDEGDHVPARDTRNLVAKFRDMEQSSQGIPSPERTPSRPVYRQNYDTTDSTPRMTMNDTSNEQPEEDGGIFENKPVVNPDLVRESDRHDTEELPERGFTKSLLQQWREKEKDHTPGSERKARSSRSSSAPPHRPRVPYGGQSGDDQDTTDGDRYQAKHTSYTRTMLSKFQTVDTESTPPRSPAKRQFKWQVKEVRPMIRGSCTPDKTDLSEREHMDNEQQGVQEYQGEQRAGGDHYADEQRDDDCMPPPSFTRTMLAKFKSLEDLTKPPPSPVRSQQQLKDSPHGTVVSVRKICAYDADSLHHPEREQPDGGEYEHDHMANEMLQYDDDDDDDEEDDTDLRHSPRRRDSQEQELPEQGTTRSLLAKFQALQTAH